MTREEERKDLIRRALTSGGAEAYAALLERFDDPEERVAIARAGIGVASSSDWAGKDLDALAEVGRTSIDECLAQGAIDGANIISYNLAATLADCWPESTLVHERRHFELGAKLGDDCLRWREELQKGPFPFSIAHWVRGMHRLDLGLGEEAVADMRAGLEYAEKHAESEGGQPVEPARHFVIAISMGYLGIARHVGGDPEGQAQFEEALDAFRTMAHDEKLREDAEFGVGQLQYVWQRLTAAP